MAFYGCEFSFDGIPCSEYGLMIYDFGSNTQGDVDFQVGDVSEERISRRYDAFMYGLTQNKPLEYTLVFGANMDSVDADDGIDRYEIDAITAWLTGHTTRKWLVVEQPDMESFRYKCIIKSLKLVTFANIPWAFSCTVSCDSPFAYSFPEEYEYGIDGAGVATIINRSGYTGYYMPKIQIDVLGSDSFIITNESDNNRQFSLTGLPHGTAFSIYVDNLNQIITNSLGINLYPNFNYNFFRLVRGENKLSFTGSGTVKFTCEFPVNIGG